jgi:glycosyltransferase involved in cell wall biosynthesis
MNRERHEARRFAGSVIIPAHNEGRVLGRTLRALLDDGEDDLDVVVVCNGCTDDTADVARAASPHVRVVEIPEPSKAAAMRAGNVVSDAFPRIHMDADVELTGAAARALARTLCHPGVLATAPERDLDVDGVSLAVRWYYEVWEALPQVRSGLFGRGVVAVTRAGQERLDAFPSLLSDDLVASEGFGVDERVITPDARVVVRPPKRLRDLIRRRVRVVTGSIQADRHGIRRPASRTTIGSLGRLMLRQPRLIPRVPIFLGVTLAARRGAARAVIAEDFTTWQRDESSRE